MRPQERFEDDGVTLADGEEHAVDRLDAGAGLGWRVRRRRSRRRRVVVVIACGEQEPTSEDEE
jgi:hypothetical protein